MQKAQLFKPREEIETQLSDLGWLFARLGSLSAEMEDGKPPPTLKRRMKSLRAVTRWLRSFSEGTPPEP